MEKWKKVALGFISAVAGILAIMCLWSLCSRQAAVPDPLKEPIPMEETADNPATESPTEAPAPQENPAETPADSNADAQPTPTEDIVQDLKYTVPVLGDVFRIIDTVDAAEPDQTQVTTMTEDVCYVSSTEANLYAEQNSDGEIVTTLPVNTPVIVSHDSENESDWLAVQLQDGTHGYMQSSDLGNPDGGYPIVTVSILNQHVTVYDKTNDKVSVATECDVVTGLDGSRSTPCGVFAISQMIAGTYLNGPTWHCWVDYWMRFVRGCGLHDAMWRNASEFGGETYKTNGSHGCVNMPHETAKAVYEMVHVGTPVIVYK